MNEVATFFRNPAGDAGITYHFQIGTERGAHHYFVYMRRRVNAVEFSDQEVKHRDLAAFHREITTSLRAHGGGIVVVASGEGTSRNIDISAIASGSYVPASRYTVLRPGYPSHWLPLDNAAKITLGSHLLIPVDPDAEEQLQTVMSLLNWFAPDVEALVSTAIGRPSFDVRLDKLENRLLGQTADATAAEAGLTWWRRFGLQLRRLATNPLLYGWGVAALLVALLGLNAYLLHRLNSKLPEVAGTPVASETLKAPKHQASMVTAAPHAAAAPTIASRTKELLAEVRARSSGNPRLKLLYDAHFAQFVAQGIDDAKARQWFSTQTSNTDARPLLLGLIKLEAMHLNPNVRDATFLERWDNITATKDVLRAVPEDQRDPDGLRLMSALACRLGYGSSPRPELPAFTNSPALVLMPDGRCDALGDETIEEGLDHLFGYVRTL